MTTMILCIDDPIEHCADDLPWPLRCEASRPLQNEGTSSSLATRAPDLGGAGLAPGHLPAALGHWMRLGLI